MLRLVVVADTHIRRGSKRRLSPAAWAHLAEGDVILHAGDVVVPELLEELGQLAPVHAVLGNNDAELVGILPETTVVDIDGLRVGMVHDSGPATGRARRLRRLYPDAGLVVFGHSHIPWNEVGIDDQVLFNPGSPTERRRQPTHTLGRIDVEDGRIVSRRIEVV